MPMFANTSRLIARLFAEMALAALVRTTQVIARDGDRVAPIERAVAVLAIIVASLPGEGGTPGLSVHALAASIDRPFETIRRQVNCLIDDGICARAATGVVVDPAWLASDDGQALLAELNDLLVWLVIQFKAFDVPIPATRSDACPDRDALAVVSANLILAGIDLASSDFESLRELYIVNAVIAGSARGVTFDAALARRYGGAATVPPPELRRGVHVKSLADALGLPAVTIYRMVRAAIATGKLERCEGGVRATHALLDGSGVRGGGRRSVARSQRSLQALALSGFPFDDPARCYVNGPPTLPRLG